MRHAVVVGGGVLGSCTALELLDRGWSVEVVDRSDPGAASRADVRILRCSHGADEGLTRSAVRGLAGWRRLESRTGAAFVEERGVLLFVSAGHPGHGERQGAAVLRRFGVPVAELGPAATARRFPQVDPDSLAFSVYEPAAGVVRAREAVSALHRLLRSSGASLAEGEFRPPVSRSADAVVWAVGARTGEVLPGVPVRAARQETYLLAGEPDDGPAWLDVGAETYGIPGTDGRATRAVLDVEADGSDGWPRLESFLARRFPGAGRTVTRKDTCAYGTTADERVIIGPLPGVPGNWLIGGDGGTGFKHAPAWAADLAGMITRMITGVDGPFGLAEHAASFAPGVVLSAGEVLGLIVATDDVETWLECHLGDRHWLAVEAPAGTVRYTLWRRAASATLPHGDDLTATERGTAQYRADGRFDPFVIPASGTMHYAEFTRPGGRVAAARFRPGAPWLVGAGTGDPIPPPWRLR